MTTKYKTVTAVLLLAVLLLAGCRGQSSYLETFDAPGKWRVGTDADAIGQVANGVYDLTVTADDVIIWTTAGESFGDGIYEMDATQVAGPLNNGYGLLFRLDNEKDDFYLFKISGDGYVWIGRYRGGGAGEAQPLIGQWWFESTAVQQGLNRTNRLKVQAEGGNMIFYVNDQEVGRVTDDAFKQGDVGLMVETLGLGGVQVQFDNVSVTPLGE
ncbi:MAG: hypothetical protein IPM39_01315 [Chloroflexi bacterium]|nr:hypothetical protein [Chloroflexota bacterium]